jgi:hypothetical protein
MPYTQRFVAFLDILGFSDIVRKSGKDVISFRADELAKALTVIGSHVSNLDKSLGDDFRFQSFSDSIVMSSVANDAGLAHLMNEIAKLTIRLLMNGMLIRGAVAKGLLYHNGDVMFGPAFLDSYHIESTISRFPRVILSRETYNDAVRVDSSFVCLDNDGPPYLNTLLLLSGDANKAMCKKVIQQLLDDSIHTPGHYEKLRWLTIYWNSTVALGRSDLQVIFPNSPTRR